MKTTLSQFTKLPFWTRSEQALVGHAGTELAAGRSLFIVTMNAEMALHAQENPAAAVAIMQADIVVADVVSLTWWLKFLYKRAVTRITGVDLSNSLVTLAAERGFTVAILGGSSDEILKNSAAELAGRGATIVYTHRGPRITQYTADEVGETVVAELIAAEPDIVFVGFGHGKQEWWITELKKRMKCRTICIGVGGTVDLWGGAVRRAPRIMRRIGLEWLWRLMLQPSRLPRIIDAVIIFPVRAIREYLL